MPVTEKKLFVGNLAYNTSDSELADAFAEYGEIKASFTVKVPGVTDKCKGYGYVVFKSKESCSKACAQVKIIKGRPVNVTLAHSKKSHQPPTKANEDHHDDESSEESDYETLTAKKEVSKTLRKPKSQRSEARFGVGKTLVLKPLPEGFTEEQLVSLCKSVEGVTCVGVTSKGAETSGHLTFDTHKNTKTALEKLSKRKKMKGINVSVLSKATKDVSQLTLRKSRLIVRNISFKCSEGDLETVFSEAGGKVVEVKIPRKENGHMLGYAFIQFSSYFDAAKVLKCVNGRSIKGRPVAVDWVVPKTTYEQSLKKTTPTNKGNKEGDKTTPINEEVTTPINKGSKEVEEEIIVGATDESDDEEVASSDGGDKEEEEEAISSDGGDKEEEEAGEEDEGAESDSGRGSVTGDASEGRTLFIRNLSVDVDYREVMKLFSRFGPIRYTRVLVDPHTHLSKGSAFLQFKKQNSVEPCLEVANGDGLHCNGNKLVVSLAVPRLQAQEFKGQNTKVKDDKRNLYLSKEGLILPESAAAEGLSKVDMARRRKAYAERKSKLSDPNYFVSRTRLSVRNLPTGVDEKMLRRVFTTAAQLPLVNVTQAKVMRSSERVDGQGLGRSKGFGFIEFKGHEDALKALRSTNNNPALFGEKRRLIVEFAVENSRALNLRAQRKQRQVGPPRRATADATAATETSELSRQQKWCLKWQTRRLKRKADTLAATTPTQAEGSKQRKKVNAAVTTTEGPSDKKTGKKTGKKRAATDAQKPPPKKAKQHGDDKTKPQPKDARNRGNRSRRRRPDVEETSLETMVNKYRSKLDKNSLSKWSQ